MGKILYYTPEVIEFIRINADKGSIWLINELKKKYNINPTHVAFSAVAKRNKIRIKTYRKGWNYYIVDFIKNNADKYTYEQMIDIIKNKFNLVLTKVSLIHFYNRNGLSHIKKQIPIGTEKIFYGKGSKENGVPYIWIKVSDDKDYKSNWIKKTHYVWQQHNGKIPEDYTVIQLDGDYKNCEITNLKLVKKSILPQVAKKYGYGIITEALCEILEFEEQLKTRKEK